MKDVIVRMQETKWLWVVNEKKNLEGGDTWRLHPDKNVLDGKRCGERTIPKTCTSGQGSKYY